MRWRWFQWRRRWRHRLWYGHWPLYRYTQGPGTLIYRSCARCEENE